MHIINGPSSRSSSSIFSVRVTLLLLLLLVCIHVKQVHTSNWAQSTGVIQQNVVMPYMPTFSNPHWSPRAYASTVHVPGTVIDGVETPGFIYTLGGDSNDNDFTLRDQISGIGDTRKSNGYKNDVWVSSGTDWDVRGDTRLENDYRIFKQKIPVVRSLMRWRLLTAGSAPAPGQTYDNYILCEAVFSNIQKYADYREANCKDQVSSHWSPRRGHATVFFNGYIYLLGGRAREYVEFTGNRTVGGVVEPVIEGVIGAKDPVTGVGLPGSVRFTQFREAVVYKSDVWRSSDGRTWELVTPGCKAPQKSLVASGNIKYNKHGLKSQQCIDSSQCYGGVSEACDTSPGSSAFGSCICMMWSPREGHSAAVSDGYMYVSGGFTSILYSQFSNCGDYACGDVDASAYRRAVADVWRSSDGSAWQLLTETAFDSLGRGAHQMLLIPDTTGVNYLWVFGGMGVDINGNGELFYYNDVYTSRPPYVNWYNSSSITVESGSPNPGYYPEPIPWEGRHGLSVVLEPGSANNLFTRHIYLIGGMTVAPEFRSLSTTKPLDTILDDCWVLRPDIAGDIWRKDFTSDSLFSTGSGVSYSYYNDSPMSLYVTPDSHLEYLRLLWLPTRFRTDREIEKGMRSEIRDYITDERLKLLNSVGLFTIRELATADKYQILKLRGYDIPQVPLDQRLHFDSICDVQELARRVVDKCTVTIPLTEYNGKKNSPGIVTPEYAGPAPAVDNILWHDVVPAATAPSDDYNELVSIYTDQWDGCTYTPGINGLFGPNVDGVGVVSQVTDIKNAMAQLQELHCQWTPGPRAYHTAVFFEERVYLLGGKSGATEYKGDTWYRDSRLPVATFLSKPKTYTTNPIFEFTSDKPGVVFEYRVWDPYNYLELRPWTLVVKKTDVGWLDWRMGGPGNGQYQMYVRAVDPAGNRDERFLLESNVYEWYYLSPTPWDIIAIAVFTFLGLAGIGYLEYRRRVKKAAMERYAMKRMRRKFKAMQRDIDGRAVDWRSLYMESKEGEALGDAKKREAMKKKQNKKAEKREREKKKREKEKEKIKSKLKAGRKKTSTKGDAEPPSSNNKEPPPSKDTAESGKSGTSVSESSPVKKDKKYKSNEKSIAIGEEETGTKERKINKRYKEYEAQPPSGADKNKDI